jgi:hypothetical protein
VVRSQRLCGPEIGATYFSIVEGGFQPVDLDPLSRKPLIGVGGSFGHGATVATLETGLSARIAALLPTNPVQRSNALSLGGIKYQPLGRHIGFLGIALRICCRRGCRGVGRRLCRFSACLHRLKFRA